MKIGRVFFGLLAAGLLFCVGGAGCDGETETDGTDTAADTITLTLPVFDIADGETFRCYYSDFTTDEEISVIDALGKQVQGGHHLSLYYVDNPREVGVQECSGTAEMVDWHFVVGAGGEGNENTLLELPEGIAFKIPAGKQLMVQAHYINVTGQPMPSDDELTIKTTDPSKVEAYAADFVVDDDTFEILPYAELTTSMICTVPQDLQLIMLLGHMHEQGAHYLLEEVDEQGNSINVLYEEDWYASYASHPPINKYGKDEPLLLKKGTRLHQTCSWKNDTAQKLLFPTEMCIGFGYYFPGTERVMCEPEAPAQP